MGTEITALVPSRHKETENKSEKLSHAFLTSWNSLSKPTQRKKQPKRNVLKLRKRIVYSHVGIMSRDYFIK